MDDRDAINAPAAVCDDFLFFFAEKGISRDERVMRRLRNAYEGQQTKERLANDVRETEIRQLRWVLTQFGWVVGQFWWVVVFGFQPK